MKNPFHKYQLVWWFPESNGWGYFSWQRHSMKMFLDYSINLGWLEIRVWKKDSRPVTTDKTQTKGSGE